MKQVILRDDDVNALTPCAFLEQLYRPCLDKNLPVNLSVIPEVSTNIVMPDGKLEGFLLGEEAGKPGQKFIGDNTALTSYLLENAGYHVIQHGLSHAFIDGHYEFDREDREDCVRRLERGAALLQQAGFPAPQTFVAPQDKLSRAALRAVAERYQILSTGWYELRRLPLGWRPRYLLKKLRGQEHWRVKNIQLLSHPGCLLSRFKRYDTMFDSVKAAIAARPLTILVTHWWEYFPNGEPDLEYIAILHRVADYLAQAPEIRVITFKDLVVH